jgi:hypothetical protein
MIKATIYRAWIETAKITIKTERGRIHCEELGYRLNSVGLENSGSSSGGSWAAASRGCKKKAWPAQPAVGNRPKSILGETKTFSFIKTPLYFQTYLIQNLNLNFERFIYAK